MNGTPTSSPSTSPSFPTTVIGGTEGATLVRVFTPGILLLDAVDAASQVASICGQWRMTRSQLLILPAGYGQVNGVVSVDNFGNRQLADAAVSLRANLADWLDRFCSSLNSSVKKKRPTVVLGIDGVAVSSGVQTAAMQVAAVIPPAARTAAETAVVWKAYGVMKRESLVPLPLPPVEASPPSPAGLSRTVTVSGEPLKLLVCFDAYAWNPRGAATVRPGGERQLRREGLDAAIATPPGDLVINLIHLLESGARLFPASYRALTENRSLQALGVCGYEDFATLPGIAKELNPQQLATFDIAIP